MDMPVNPSSIISTVCSVELYVLNQINRKFAALQRLAQLLEQLGDIIPVIDVSALVAINVGLDLPAITAVCPAITSINQLIAAYNSLIKQLQGHPYSLMGNLQLEMGKFQLKIGLPSLPVLPCCSGGGSSAAIAQALSTFNSGYGAVGGQVLTSTQQTKAAQVDTAITTIVGLGGTESISYADTLAASGSNTTPFIPVESAGTLYTTLPYVPIDAPMSVTVITSGTTEIGIPTVIPTTALAPVPPASRVASTGFTTTIIENITNQINQSSQSSIALINNVLEIALSGSHLAYTTYLLTINGSNAGNSNGILIPYTSGTPPTPPNPLLPAMAYDITGTLPTLGWDNTPHGTQPTSQSWT